MVTAAAARRGNGGCARFGQNLW